MFLLILLSTISYPQYKASYIYPDNINPEVVIYIDYLDSTDNADTIQYKFTTTLMNYLAFELYGYIDSLRIEAKTYMFLSDTSFNRWKLIDEIYEIDSIYRSGLSLNYGKWTEIRLINLSDYYIDWGERSLWEREFTFRFLMKR